ncbi:MAG: hypothetical protein QM691_13790 [Opitutaceae bacterium]
MGEIRQFRVERDKRQALTDDTCLWRYVPLKTLLVYLSGQVFIPSIETLRKQDPFEGEFYYDPICFGAAINRWFGARGLQTVLGEYYGDAAKIPGNRRSAELSTYLETLRATRTAWCWFEDSENAESAAMWNLYGRDGAAVVSTVGRIKAALANCQSCFEFGRMWYLRIDDEESVIDQEELYPEGHDFYSELTLRPHFIKRAEYKGEKEVRFIGSISKPSSGTKLPLQPRQWIENIRINPSFEETEVAAIMAAASRAEIRCSQSGMLRKTPPNIKEFIRAELSPAVPAEMQQLWSTNGTATTP